LNHLSYRLPETVYRFSVKIAGLIEMEGRLPDRGWLLASTRRRPLVDSFLIWWQASFKLDQEFIIERSRVGLEAAKQQDRASGQRRQMTNNKVEATKKPLTTRAPSRSVTQNPGVLALTLCPMGPALFPNTDIQFDDCKDGRAFSI